MASFEWTSLYKAIAQKIYDTKDGERQELIQEVLASLKKQDLLTDSFFDSGEIKRIDPLSLFGLFNYDGCPTRDILSIVTKKFKLSATIPSGILGIPSNYKGDLYLANPKRNNASDFNEAKGLGNLWTLFQTAIEFSKNKAEAKKSDFVSAYDVVKTHSKDQKFEFTKRLYQMCPDTFLPLDDRTREYLFNLLNEKDPTSAKGYEDVLKNGNVPDGMTYLDLIDKIRGKLVELNYDTDHPFVDLSFRAWIAPKNEHLSGICSEAYNKWSGKDPKDGYLFFREKQKIWFGAPGTGKSFNVNDLTSYLNELGGCSFRTTFHPDYDYATFVGCYKPCPDGKGNKEITYQFIPQVFTNAYVAAWKFWESNMPKPVVLVIEEINRGNCAQIFGQIFQLLDRDKFGFSEYPVTMDQDLQRYLLASEIKDAPYVEGGELVLPPNFFIFATMNTSDQSLFPMDSAFKRRWGWEYVPIDYSGDPGKWKIQINDKQQYSWKDFLIAINEKILEKLKSPDKQLGERFVKADEGGIIDQKTFVNKVMFYLVGDAFKEDSTIRDICKGASDDKTEIVFADFADETKVKVDGKDKTQGAANLEKFFIGLGVNKVP